MLRFFGLYDGKDASKLCAQPLGIKIVNEEMVKLMGSETTELKLKAGNEITVIMMMGLQGAGKTTTAAKIAGKLKAKGKKPLLVACDIYRPAAIDQLQVNGEKQGVPVFSMGTNHKPVNIAKAAMEHAKSNDMTLKMKLMEPEQAKIQEKYARRKDEESQRMMQMEMMQLYKKYKVGLGGCLMPFLQFPIFMAVFRAVSRLPYTNGSAGSADWVSKINSTVFGVDLFQDKTGGNQPAQLIGIIILCVLVVGTQVLQQLLANKKQKEQQEKAQADIPAYRRQSVNQSNQMASQMKIMMWSMTGMMGVFVFSSAAGLGVYWLIGNVYAIVQQIINSKTSEQRFEKLKQKHVR